jgi:dihydropteroate synthase-like protein
MKVLLVTGRLAEAAVRRHALEAKVETTVIVLPVPVASLLTPELIAQHLSAIDLSGYSMIIIPGLIRGDASIVEKMCAVPTFKGPRYSADIPTVLNMLDVVHLSKTEAADKVLSQTFEQQAALQLNEVEFNRDSLLKCPGNFLVGNVPIGKGFPMRVIAEILDAPALSDREIQSRAKYYAESGAEIIDIGMTTGNPQPREAARAVKAVKSLNLTPVAIDTFDIEEAKAAVGAGADLLLSLDASSIVEASSFARDIPVIVIPMDNRGNYSPKEPQARAKALARNVSRARELGYRRIIADPIADPLIAPALTDSIVCYHLFSRRHPEVPLLFGAGNVTELLDADSVGVNALLGGIAAEVGASLLLTTEGSDKTLGAVRELSIASKMMFLAKKRSSVPKDLGLDLLILKEKRRLEEPYEGSSDEEARAIEARPISKGHIDEAGCYRIMIDRQKERVVAIRFVGAVQREVVKGKDATSVYGTLIEMGLVTRLDHAAYLGRELAKAEIALKLGRSYTQDQPLFPEDGDEL